MSVKVKDFSLVDMGTILLSDTPGLFRKHKCIQDFIRNIRQINNIVFFRVPEILSEINPQRCQRYSILRYLSDGFVAFFIFNPATLFSDRYPEVHRHKSAGFLQITDFQFAQDDRSGSQ